jgi:hypothetical protein
MRKKNLLIIFSLTFLFSSIANAASWTWSSPTTKKGYATSTNWEFITDEMDVGHNDNLIVNDVTCRAFAWFDIPIEIQNGTIKSATITVTVKDLTKWNEKLYRIELWSLGKTWNEFSEQLGSGSNDGHYNYLYGSNYIDAADKNKDLTYPLFLPDITNKKEVGFSFRAFPEIPSGKLSDQTNQITITDPWIFIEYEPPISYIQISGPTQVNENSTAQYSCIAYYSNGSSSTVTSSASWSENSSYASISDSGVLTTNLVSSDKSCTITASYGGKSDTHTVTIRDTSNPERKAIPWLPLLLHDD